MTTTAPPEADPRLIQRVQGILDGLRAEVAAASTEDEVKAVTGRLLAWARRLRARVWEPYPWQHPHYHPEGWVSARNGKPDPDGVCDPRCHDLPAAVIPAHGRWLELGGRGTGKTEGAAHYVNRHVEEGPACDPRVPGGHRLTIVAPTQADAVASCVTGVSGLQAINPGITLTTTNEGTIARWPNGAVARVLGAHSPADVERLRAWTNVCCVWVEEAAAMRQLAGVMEQAPYTLRLAGRERTDGGGPHFVISTTPKNRPEVHAIIDRAGPRTKGRTRDAHRLLSVIRDALMREFGGTSRGRQELDAEVIGDVEGALWVQHRPDLIDGVVNTDDRPGLDNDRVPEGSVGGWTPHDTLDPEARFRIPVAAPPPANPTVRVEATVVGVDPAGGATENGISVVGVANGHGYVLADLTTKGGPDYWGKVAVLAWLDYGAVGIALERTFGGDQSEHVIATAAEALGVPMPAILRAPTQEGKKQRALPLQALAQQRRFHMVGHHPLLEDELTGWVEDETPESPNRLDAMVHAARHLLVRAKPAKAASPVGRRRTRGANAAWGSTSHR